MMARVYLETSFISACVTNRTDTASVYRRDVSQDWWSKQSTRHDVFISAEVIAELSRPTYPLSSKALDLIRNVPALDLDPSVQGLAAILVKERVMPGPAQGDAVHVAAAAVHRCEYLLTWNVRHLANRNKLAHLTTICLRTGLVAPQILTPDLLWENEND